MISALLLLIMSSLQAHNHGEAQLIVVLEERVLTIELQADLADLAGFEHAPETEAERAAIQSLHDRLTGGSQWFQFPRRASCVLQDATSDGGYKPGNTSQDDGHQEHLVTARWSWNCGDPDRLRRVEADLFADFPAIEQVDAVVLTEDGQTGATLTAARPGVKLP